jgi:hypothetical protein
LTSILRLRARVISGIAEIDPADLEINRADLLRPEFKVHPALRGISADRPDSKADSAEANARRGLVFVASDTNRQEEIQSAQRSARRKQLRLLRSPERL